METNVPFIGLMSFFYVFGRWSIANVMQNSHTASLCVSFLL
ncbi:hypothetical protein KNP414_05027 [Paenibacillus mucilaginosus KNP414]|uniref:Uncharacterized protein n=1 Tax=Paenibacillus mucilaginosus (strain KNP414) TaxID=1036673 RepID=F8F6N6_PAEMK|nr:hypothetical protein KNP414_05027 [Paenibacillus mucilaginosus KNP414]